VDYRLISCDDHLDLNFLPQDVWSDRLPARLRERGPRVEEHDGATLWMCDGARWGFWAGGYKPTNAPKPIVMALDRGGESDLSERRPAVPTLRLADMDRDGVHAHVMYGPVTSIRTDDPELRDACYRAYNDWLEEFCSVAPDRLVGVAMLPEVPESATAELYRLADKGCFRQANVQIANANPRLHDPRWEPFWAALEETGLILSFHVTVFMLPKDDPGFGKPAGQLNQAKMFIEQFLDPFVDLFSWGILERHPKIKLVMAESGLGWLPWVVEELDYRHWRIWETKEYWEERGGIPFKKKPSEIFKEQVYATFQQDPVALTLLKFFGENNVLWASDYPHPDSIWPHSREVIEREMAHLSPEMRKKLTHDNAARLYGLSV
jgi:uncharacterized protein